MVPLDLGSMAGLSGFGSAAALGIIALPALGSRGNQDQQPMTHDWKLTTRADIADNLRR